MKNKMKHFDFTLIITPLILTAFGVVMIYSASMVIAVVQLEVPSNYYLIKQIKWFAIGASLFFITAFIPYYKYQKVIKIIVFSVIFMLILVLFIGKNVNNAKSWFDFGTLSFQPSEIAKLGLIMYLSSVYSKKLDYINNFGRAVVPPLILTALILGLISMQPDIGTAAIVLLIAGTVIISSGIRIRHILLLTSLGAGLLAVAIPSMATDERIARFTGAFQPFSDPGGDGYHLIQSYLAIGNGGFFGQGLGQSVQKLGYLLEPHTDFIMAVIAEELGLIGVLIVIGLLATIVLRGFYIAGKCKNPFGSLLAIGISSMIGIQALINMGAVSGLLPITGVPLPFVSYGGSSLVVLMISMGILNNIAWHVRKQEDMTPKIKTSKPVPSSKNEGNVVINSKGGRTWVN